jgi:hypothetical protein
MDPQTQKDAPEEPTHQKKDDEWDKWYRRKVFRHGAEVSQDHQRRSKDPWSNPDDVRHILKGYADMEPDDD